MKKQINLKNEWKFSVIDDGYGKEDGLYEVGMWKGDVASGKPKGIIRVKGFLAIAKVFDLLIESMENPEIVYEGME